MNDQKERVTAPKILSALLRIGTSTSGWLALGVAVGSLVGAVSILAAVGAVVGLIAAAVDNARSGGE